MGLFPFTKSPVYKIKKHAFLFLNITPSLVLLRCEAAAGPNSVVHCSNSETLGRDDERRTQHQARYYKQNGILDDVARETGKQREGNMPRLDLPVTCSSLCC